MSWWLLGQTRRKTGWRWPRWMYLRYLRSKQWKALRKKVILRANGKCERCATPTKRFDVHHLTYERLGCERLIDLTALCRNCHKRIHSL